MNDSLNRLFKCHQTTLLGPGPSCFTALSTRKNKPASNKLVWLFSQCTSDLYCCNGQALLCDQHNHAVPHQACCLLEPLYMQSLLQSHSYWKAVDCQALLCLAFLRIETPSDSFCVLVIEVAPFSNQNRCDASCNLLCCHQGCGSSQSQLMTCNCLSEISYVAPV